VTKGDLAKSDNEVAPGCTGDKYWRYKTLVCGSVLNECTLDWCHEYKHELKKKFGSCNIAGCPPAESKEEEKAE